MRRVSVVLFGLALAAGCVRVETAFQAWGVSSGGVPAYEFEQVGSDEPGLLFSVQIVDQGWTEQQARQVAADVIEDRRRDYAAIVIRILAPETTRLAAYAANDTGAHQLRAAGFQPGEVAEHGYPFLAFVQTVDEPAPEE